MPNHSHLLFRLRGVARLRTVLQQIKGSSSIKINKLLGRSGAFWVRESFDHIIRDEAQWQEKIDYITCNPVKRALVTNAADYPWLFLKKATG